MKYRPSILRMLPPRIRQSVAARFYFKSAASYPQLFEKAPLTHVDGVTMKLQPGDGVSNSIAFNGFYELLLTRQIRKLASDSSGLMIDVGANLGYFSLIWAASNKLNQVMAFEPSPRTVPFLKQNIQENCLGDRISLQSKAVSDTNSFVEFDVGPDDQFAWGGISATTTMPEDDVISVESIRLDDMVDATAEVRLLKIDVEGADTWALRGAERLFRNRQIDVCFYEQNPVRMKALGIEAGEAQSFLSSVGYESTPVDKAGFEWVARAA